MIIYPAMDLRKGACVRLYQGDYQRETVYSADPFEILKSYVSQGASWLHLVDLDGAKNPAQNQFSLITELIQTNEIKVQIGGGIRSQAQIKNLFACGAARVVIGSLAVTNQREVAEWLKYYGPERIVLAFDVTIQNNQPLLAIEGWQKITAYSLYDLIEFYQTFGLSRLLCTNISLDGTLQGPDFELYDTILKRYPFLKLQASGGIRSLSDLKRLRQNKLNAAIIGRALYENKIKLEEAFTC